MDPDIPLKKVPICMRAAMRFAISKHLENPHRDEDSDVSSVKSADYKINAKLEFSDNVPYISRQFRDPKKEDKVIDETRETKKTIYLEPWQRVPKLIAEPHRLFFRNVDDTKLFTVRYMK